MFRCEIVEEVGELAAGEGLALLRAVLDGLLDQWDQLLDVLDDRGHVAGGEILQELLDLWDEGEEISEAFSWAVDEALVQETSDLEG